FNGSVLALLAAALMSLLIFVGGSCVLASSLSAMRPLRLPPSREWPAGYVWTGVVTTAEGKHVVPLLPAGRVQIYDSEWHFIRGWSVDAWGGHFNVRCPSKGVIEVFTMRGERHYSFTEEGVLISSKPLTETV